MGIILEYFLCSDSRFKGRGEVQKFGLFPVNQGKIYSLQLIMLPVHYA